MMQKSGYTVKFEGKPQNPPAPGSGVQSPRIRQFEAELLSVCQRETEACQRHDARISTTEAQVAAADRLEAAVQKYEAMAADRGGAYGPKGRAYSAWLLVIAEMVAALAAYRATKGE